MKLLSTIERTNYGPMSVILAVIVSVFFVVTLVDAATTIGTNITTDGTLNVVGRSTLTTASTTILSTTGNLLVNGYATTTASNGDFQMSGALTVNGHSTLTTASTTILSTTGNLLVNGNATTTASNGNFQAAGAATIDDSLSVATTSTSVMLNIGAGGSATTTIDLGKVCFRITASDKTVLYVSLNDVLVNGNHIFSTSTVSCM